MRDGLPSGFVAHVGTIDPTRRSTVEIVADVSAVELRAGVAPVGLVADLSAADTAPDPSPVPLEVRLAGAEFDPPDVTDVADV
jgi:hypothetical protein